MYIHIIQFRIVLVTLSQKDVRHQIYYFQQIQVKSHSRIF